MNSRRKSGSSPHDELASALETSKVPAISRAAAVLRLLGKSSAPLGLYAIAKELGIIPSTCLHMLRVLVFEQFVAFDPKTKQYSLDVGLLILARNWLQRNQFHDLAQPELDRISVDFQVTTFGLHVVGLDYVVVVAVSQSGASLQLSTPIGSRFPALVGAAGRCITAFGKYSEAEIKRQFSEFHGDRKPDFGEWMDHAEAARAQGFAVDPGHYIQGVTAIAAPVWRSEKLLSHILVAVKLGTLKGKEKSELGQAVVSAAQAISSVLVRDFVQDA